MSLRLSFSHPEVNCKSFSKANGQGFFGDGLFIGEYSINKNDFMSLVMYIMTNTDLEENDCRLKLIERINKLHQVEGFNVYNMRLEEPI